MERSPVFARAASALVVTLCGASLTAWASDVDVARRAFPTLVPMNPVTAVVLALGALAVLSLRGRALDPWHRRLVHGCGWGIALVGAVSPASPGGAAR